MGNARVGWHEYFMQMAQHVASRATCDRKHVGAVIVRDRTVLSTGYNGSIRGFDHCDEVGHLMENDHCVGTVHAEANAIIQAAKNGVAIDAAELYTTASPCWPCFMLIANAGIRRVYYGDFYRDRRSLEVASRLGIELIDLSAAKDAAGSPESAMAGEKDRSGLP
jgi:dCMP deaminase